MRAPGHFSNKNNRKALILATSISLVTALSDSRVIAQDISLSATPAQLAAAIARTMSSTRPTSSQIAQQFSSHDNVVESRTIFKDANDFAKVAARRLDVEMQLTRYMCKAERLAYIKKGVVFHNVNVGPDTASSFEFVIDERACAALANPVAADTATLVKMAQELAPQLTSALSTQQPADWLHFEKAVAQDGVIHINYIITVPAFVDFVKFRSFEFRGKTQGLLCQKFGDVFRKGVRGQVVYQLQDGSPVLEFPVDNTVC